MGHLICMQYLEEVLEHAQGAPGGGGVLQDLANLGKVSILRERRGPGWTSRQGDILHPQVKALEGLLDDAWERMAGEMVKLAWRDNMVQHLMTLTPGRDVDRDLSRMGAQATDAGILLMGNNTLVSNLQVGVMHVLQGGRQDTRLVKAPLGVLLMLTDLTEDQLGEGDPRNAEMWNQVAPEPCDLTPHMEETILGLYDPDSSGAMSQLSLVIEAARDILK